MLHLSSEGSPRGLLLNFQAMLLEDGGMLQVSVGLGCSGACSSSVRPPQPHSCVSRDCQKGMCSWQPRTFRLWDSTWCFQPLTGRATHWLSLGPNTLLSSLRGLCAVMCAHQYSVIPGRCAVVAHCLVHQSPKISDFQLERWQEG